MPDALRTATPMGVWKSFKFTCDVSAGMLGIKDARDVDVLGDRHSYLYLVEDTVVAALESGDYGDEIVGIYNAEKILVPKMTGQGYSFAVGQRIYWDQTTRLVKPGYDSADFWIGICTEPATINDLYVEIDLCGDRAEIEANLP